MQGAAGMWAQPVDYLQAMRELCRQPWDSFHCRRSRHRLWPHRENVRVRPCRRDAGYSLCRQGHHRRLFAAGGDARHRRYLRGVSRRLQRFQDFLSRPHLYRQSARLRRRHRQSRTVRQRRYRRENATACIYAAAALARRISAARPCQRYPPVGLHDRHRVGAGQGEPKELPGRNAHRPSSDSRSAQARRDDPAARRCHRADAAVEHDATAS